MSEDPRKMLDEARFTTWWKDNKARSEATGTSHHSTAYRAWMAALKMERSQKPASATTPTKPTIPSAGSAGHTAVATGTTRKSK